MAVYCNECGSGNPDGSEFCSRCGAAIAQIPAFAGELVLPEWLTRAAAEMPEPVPSSPRSRAIDVEERAPAPPLTSIPSGNLDATIPAWLKGPVRQAAQSEPEESLLIDPTDTKGFISEDDLPAWIRQIAVADAARKAEAERKTAAAEAVADEPVVETPAPAKRRLLPGEIEAVRGAANPWLARGDRAAADDPAPRTQPAAEPIQSDSPPMQQDAVALKASAPDKKPKTLPSPGNLNLRGVLIGAIVLLLVILVIALVL